MVSLINLFVLSISVNRSDQISQFHQLLNDDEMSFNVNDIWQTSSALVSLLLTHQRQLCRIRNSAVISKFSLIRNDPSLKFYRRWEAPKIFHRSIIDPRRANSFSREPRQLREARVRSTLEVRPPAILTPGITTDSLTRASRSSKTIKKKFNEGLGSTG